MNLREKLLKTTDDVKKAMKVPFQVRKDKKSLESWIINKEEEVATLEMKINDAKGADVFAPDRILDYKDDLALVERRLKEGKKLLKEMFETSVKE